MDLRRGRGKERVFGDSSSGSSGTSSLRRETKDVLYDNHVHNVREGVRGLRLEESSAAKKKEFVERYSRLSEFPTDRCESVNSSVGDVSSQLRYGMNQWGVERDRYEGIYGNPGGAAERGRMPISGYPNEGSSSYHSEYGYSEQKYDVNGVEDIGPDRTELLRKLNQLKEQLSRSYGATDRPRDMIPPERSRTPPDHYGDLLTYSLSLQQQYAVDKQMPRSRYVNYSHGQVPIMDHHNTDVPNYYPPQRNHMNVIPEYDDPSQPQMKRDSHHPLTYVQPQHGMGQHMGFNRNTHAQYPHEHVVHSSACTCPVCYSQNWVLPPQVPDTNFGNRSIPKGPVNSSSYHRPATQSPHNYPRDVSPMLQTRRWQGDIEKDLNCYSEHPLGKMINRKTQISRPFRGGAPFITCFHCFELLKLPRKCMKRSKYQSELCCGSCSTVISLEVNNKRLVTSAPKECKPSSEVDQHSKRVVKSNILNFPDCVSADDTNSYHDDLDNSDQNLQLIVAEDNSLVEDERLILDESEKRESHSSQASISSQEEEGIQDSMVKVRDVSDPSEMLIREACSPTAPGSPLWEQPNSPSKHEVSRDEDVNKGACIEQDKVIFTNGISAENAEKEMSVENVVDDSFNDYLKTNISQDSTDTRKEDRPKVRKGSDNFLIGFIKNSLKDSSRSYQNVERTKVLINGQPIPDHLIRKAEKLAGTIQPGDYWYDSRAGFWGVMGQPCLGIIPPFIEEFSYPMPTNCSAGDTGVYINGRELHQRDLDLLASRGLPTTRDRYYTLDISGRLVDNDSGEKLKGLGKLAPTIEKAKHGFGMKVPRVAV